VVQRVTLDSSDVRIGTWCQILEGVPAAAFDAARRGLGLEPGAAGGLSCHFGDRVYGRPAVAGPDGGDLASEIVRRLSPNGYPRPARLVEDDAVGEWLGAPGVVVLRPPALDKAAVRWADSPLLPPKSTRFLVPYRVLGLGVSLSALAGPLDALTAEVERERRRPLGCLGAGLAVDRRYPERLWQFADHRIPDELFSDEAGRRAYAAALARARLPAPSRPFER